MSESQEQMYLRIPLIQRNKQARIPPPVAVTMGFELTALEPGRAVLEMNVDERHHNPMGTVHGGIIADLVDAAMGVAHMSALQPGMTHTTVEFKINFMRAVYHDRIRAIATVKRTGRKIGVTECDVLDSADKLLAHALGTLLIMPEQET